ncbi:MAG: hypothetical protein ABIA78_03630 [archaeon]
MVYVNEIDSRAVEIDHLKMLAGFRYDFSCSDVGLCTKKVLLVASIVAQKYFHEQEM